jgi:hypothetical protein
VNILPEEFDLEHFTKTVHFKAWDRVAQLGRRPWEQAREWARGLGINSSEWRVFCKTDKKPVDIPADPHRAYSREWTDWRDFLGAPSEEEDMNEYIKEYKKNAKGKLIPFPIDEFVTESGYKLGTKMKALKNSYLKKQLPDWKKKIIQTQLIDKGLYDWDGRDVYSWKKHFEAYKSFKNKTGINIPQKDTIYEGFSIEIWVQLQKAKYKVLKNIPTKRTNKPLEKWQLKLLKSINFPFEDTYKDLWIERYKQYKPIIEKNKGKAPHSNKPLVKWVQAQKRKYKEKTLTKSQIILLEKIKFWSWNPFEERLENNLQSLELFVNKTGNSNPKQSVVYKGFAVGRFLSKIRMKFREDKTLDKKIIKRIEKLGIKLKPSRIVGSVYYYD